jgi:hypothetical protein
MDQKWTSYKTNYIHTMKTQNLPQTYSDKYKTYFYKNTIQPKNEYQHLFEPFIQYFNQTNNNTHPHYIQFCILNNQCPQLYLFYAWVITLATTSNQYEIVITPNTIQWTNNIIMKLTQLSHPHKSPPTSSKISMTTTKPYKPTKHNPWQIILIYYKKPTNLRIPTINISILTKNPPDRIPKMSTIHPKFYAPCINTRLPNYNTTSKPTHIVATSIITWNYGSLNTTILGLQSIITKNPQPTIVVI